MTLCTYSKEVIPVLGCLLGCSFMVVESGAALPGLSLFNALHMSIEGRKVVDFTSASASSATKCTAAIPLTPLAALPASLVTPIQYIACAKGFVHKIKLVPNAIPVQQKLRRLPSSYRQLLMS